MTVAGLALSGLAAAAFLPAGRWLWAAGLVVGAFWVFLNTYFLFQILEMGFNPKARHRDKLLLFSILKFPVLYLAGFFILKSRFFPVWGILTGAGIYLAAFLVGWARFNVGGKMPEKALR